MAEEAAGGSVKGADKKKSGPVVLIVRVLVFGTLGVLLVLAVLDYLAKSAASETGQTWNKLLGEADESGDDLTLAKLPEPKGQPDLKTDETNSLILNTYTWNGVFRTYSVTVTAVKLPNSLLESDPDASPSVSQVEGTGVGETE